mgnify:FL=1
MKVRFNCFFSGNSKSQTDLPPIPTWPYVPFGSEILLPLGSEVTMTCSRYSPGGDALLAWKLESVSPSTSAIEIRRGSGWISYR